jgi:hypothetical protein
MHLVLQRDVCAGSDVLLQSLFGGCSRTCRLNSGVRPILSQKAFDPRPSRSAARRLREFGIHPVIVTHHTQRTDLDGVRTKAKLETPVVPAVAQLNLFGLA